MTKLYLYIIYWKLVYYWLYINCLNKQEKTPKTESYRKIDEFIPSVKKVFVGSQRRLSCLNSSNLGYVSSAAAAAIRSPVNKFGLPPHSSTNRSITSSHSPRPHALSNGLKLATRITHESFR